MDTNDIPEIAVVDPDMMSSMPKGLTAATGMDALTHAIEGYITKGHCVISDMFHLEAIKLISQSLRGAVHRPIPVPLAAPLAWKKRSKILSLRQILFLN